MYGQLFYILLMVLFSLCHCHVRLQLTMTDTKITEIDVMNIEHPVIFAMLAYV